MGEGEEEGEGEKKEVKENGVEEIKVDEYSF